MFLGDKRKCKEKPALAGLSNVCLSLENSFRHKQDTILHIGARGTTIEVTVANNLLPLAVVLYVYNVASSGVDIADKLESFHGKVHCFCTLLSWINLLNAGKAIREAVVELWGSKFGITASATDHGESPKRKGVLPFDGFIVLP